MHARSTAATHAAGGADPTGRGAPPEVRRAVEAILFVAGRAAVGRRWLGQVVEVLPPRGRARAWRPSSPEYEARGLGHLPAGGGRRLASDDPPLGAPIRRAVRPVLAARPADEGVPGDAGRGGLQAAGDPAPGVERAWGGLRRGPPLAPSERGWCRRWAGRRARAGRPVRHDDRVPGAARACVAGADLPSLTPLLDDAGAERAAAPHGESGEQRTARPSRRGTLASPERCSHEPKPEAEPEPERLQRTLARAGFGSRRRRRRI
jgi:hypothetical protein